jgi:hypothetical protein
MTAANPIDLVQDVTTDCSVVASLCAGIARGERGYSKVAGTPPHPNGKYRILILTDKTQMTCLIKMYPHDTETSAPQMSPSGKYIFRLHFNGCYRKVVIDDRLPSSKTPQAIHVVDRNNPTLLWPALVEKAYLKVRGGYDFPGSNSGTDLWILTGWIPEQIFLHHEDVTSDQLWKRLFAAFNYGDVLLTIGTGKLTEQEESGLGLLREHDYAILDMKETGKHRQFLVKNPWAGGAVWKRTRQLGADSTFGEADLEVEHPNHSQLSPGTFWMDCESVFQNFENLYLNWNPTLFAYRQDIHFSWDLSEFGVIPGCFARNPQFAVMTKAGGPVWLLLSRHFKSGDYSKPGAQLLEVSSESDQPGFVSIYVFKKDGQRVCLSDSALHRGPYVDSPNTLMRLEMPPDTTYTAVVAEQSLQRSSHNFSLSGFSTNPLTIAHAVEKYSQVKKFQSAWTLSTAGGNADSERYHSNPQFSLELLDSGDVAVLLETEDTELATHVKILWSNGDRVSTVRSRDIAADSGDYRRCCAVAEKYMLKGTFTIVCSTFARDQLGKFTLWISTTRPCRARPLPAEGAGQLVTTSGVGIFVPGSDRILAPLTATRLTRLKLVGRPKGSWIGGRSVAPSPMLMTLELGQGPYKEILAASGDGDFSDAITGFWIEDFDLDPQLHHRGGIWLVVERIGGPGGLVDDRIEVDILSEERVEIGPWGSGDG